MASLSAYKTQLVCPICFVLFGRNEPALHPYHNTYREALGMEPLELIDQ
jgi:hypothetical protein